MTHDPLEAAPELAAQLEALQQAIFKYPMAIQAAFRALAAEGRRFAESPDGAARLERLARAKALGRARLLWEVLSLRGFSERADEPLPGVFVEALVRALQEQHLEPLLGTVLEKRL